MRQLRGFLVFCYDFVVGDDWRLALGAVVGLAITAALAHGGVPAWWVLPLCVATVLALSLRRAVHLMDPTADPPPEAAE